MLLQFSVVVIVSSVYYRPYDRMSENKGIPSHPILSVKSESEEFWGLIRGTIYYEAMKANKPS